MTASTVPTVAAAPAPRARRRVWSIIGAFAASFWILLVMIVGFAALDLGIAGVVMAVLLFPFVLLTLVNSAWQ